MNVILRPEFHRIVHTLTVIYGRWRGTFIKLLACFCALIILSGLSFPGELLKDSGKAYGYSGELSEDEASVRNVLTLYHKALTSNDIKLIEEFVVTDNRFAMVEGKHTNWGWEDYRDNHLSAELADLNKVDFRLDFKLLHISGDMAYASFIFALSPKGDPAINYGSGRSTVVLIRDQKGWLIQHLHTS